MNDTVYTVCKYTPLELLAGYGLPSERLDPNPVSFTCAEGCAHPNLCGFGKAVLEEVMGRGIRRLLLTDCCDVCRRIYDILLDQGEMEFLFLMTLPHKDGSPEVGRMERELGRLCEALEVLSGKAFNRVAAETAWDEAAGAEAVPAPHILLSGAHGGSLLLELLRERSPLPVIDGTCTGNRRLSPPSGTWADGTRAVGDGFSSRIGISEPGIDQSFLQEYAAALLCQSKPCMRMQFRKEMPDADTSGVVLHTMKFCDYYSFQYHEIKNTGEVPLLKIETDATPQSSGQLRTRIDAFAETLHPDSVRLRPVRGGAYVAGIDSGSSSTDAVILDRARRIVGSAILPTGAGAASGAQLALEEALRQAGLSKEDLTAVVTTGYGRETLGTGDASVTEITCHARGAHFLDPQVRTVIDIGGQDSKVICLDAKGNVTGFVMNDKCAAGTGRFLESMARALQVGLAEMSELGMHWKDEVAISSMCTVFAESEVVSLVAQNTPVSDIVHGLNRSIASKTVSLIRRADGEPRYIMTGGVARNKGVVRALEEKLGMPIHVPEEAQLCGALGAALIAWERTDLSSSPV